MKEKTFNRLKKIAKFLGTAAILGVADSLGGSATVSVGENNRKVYSYHEPKHNTPTYLKTNYASYCCDHDKKMVIDDISEAVENMNDDYYKFKAAEQISKIVRTYDDAKLKYHAACKIAKIADSMDDSYYQTRVIDIATKLLGG